VTRAGIALLAMCLDLPGGAHGQQPDLASRLDPPTLAAVQPILDAAARDSLPLEALRSKALEGVAKGAGPQQIGDVVASLADEFRTARVALRGGLPGVALRDGEVVAAAMAARRDVPLDVVRGLWASRPDEGSLEVPVTVLGELVRRGIRVDEAATLMSHVVRTSVPLEVAAQIPGKLDGARTTGAPPGAALAEALRGLNIPDAPGRGRGRGRGRGPGG
jgi:hypothetical protein